MNKDDKGLLLGAFSAVFEGFAFMFVEEEPYLEPDGHGLCLQAAIAFRSTENKGFMEIVAPIDFCTGLAENILGADAGELPDDAGENALKEVLNVSCGYFLAEKFGTEIVFDLSIPVTSLVSEKKWITLLEGRQHTPFLVDESPILARFGFSS